jgi:hypothetical protein
LKKSLLWLVAMHCAYDPHCTGPMGPAQQLQRARAAQVVTTRHDADCANEISKTHTRVATLAALVKSAGTASGDAR